MLSLALLSVMVAAPPIELHVGEQKIISVARPAKARVERSSVAQLRALDGERVLLIGVSPGKTVLLADGARRDLIITPVDEAALVGKVHALLDGTPVLAGWDGACVWLECPTCSAAQRERVAQVRGLYPCVRAVDVIAPGRPALEVLQGVRALLGEHADDAEVDVRDGRVVIVGIIRSADDVQRMAQVRAQWPEAVVHVETRP